MTRVTRKLVISNTVFSGLASLVVQIINLFVLPLFVENLGSELYGIWVISGIILGYLGLMDFGFGQGITRYVADAYQKKDYERLSSVVMSGCLFLAAAGIVVSIVVILGRHSIVDFFEVSEEHRYHAVNLLFVTGMFSLISWPQRITSIALQAVLRIKEQQMLSIVTTTLSAICMLTLVCLSCDIVLMKILMCAVSVILWVPSWIMVKKYIPEIRWTLKAVSFARVKEMSSFSLGMFYFQLLIMMASKFDNIIIGRMISISAVTQYAVAVKLNNLISQYTRMLMGALTPTVFALNAQGDQSKLSSLLFKGVVYRIVLASPLACLGIIVSPYFIQLWMGEEYLQFAVWSQLMLCHTLVIAFAVSNAIARGIGKVKECNAIYTMKVAVNVVASVLLVKRFGVGGVILGTLVSNIVLSEAVLFPYYCGLSGLPWKPAMKKYWKVILHNLPVLLGGYAYTHFRPLKTWYALVVFSLIYLLAQYSLLYALALSDDEKVDVRSLLENVGLTRVYRYFKRVMA